MEYKNSQESRIALPVPMKCAYEIFTTIRRFIRSEISRKCIKSNLLIFFHFKNLLFYTWIVLALSSRFCPCYNKSPHEKLGNAVILFSDVECYFLFLKSKHIIKLCTHYYHSTLSPSDIPYKGAVLSTWEVLI